MQIQGRIKEAYFLQKPEKRAEAPIPAKHEMIRNPITQSCPIDSGVNPSCHLSILDGGSDSKTLENIQKMPLEGIKAISQLCDQCLRRSQS